MGGLPSLSATLADRESRRDEPKRVEDFLKKVSKVFTDPEVYKRCFNFAHFLSSTLCKAVSLQSQRPFSARWQLFQIGKSKSPGKSQGCAEQ